VTGFSDAVASFTYSRSGKQLALYFAVKADPELLEQLQEFFGGIGRIYSAARYFRVSRRDELTRVVSHFDDYPLRSRKQKVFSIWRQMVIAKQEFRRPDRKLLATLADQISSER
jgi:hypothetical protein